jgi:hypothetical protein
MILLGYPYYIMIFSMNIFAVSGAIILRVSVGSGWARILNPTQPSLFGLGSGLGLEFKPNPAGKPTGGVNPVG